MKSLFTISAIMLIALATVFPAHAAIETTDISRYMKIVDRKPFGELEPAKEAPPEAVMPPQESFAKHLELRAIIDDGETIRVGLFHNQQKRSFSLSFGETIDGIELISADYDQEEVLLRKGFETSVVSLQATSDAVRTEPTRVTTNKRTSQALARRRPFFTQREREDTPDIKTGESATPFRGKTIESFLRENPDAAFQHPSPLRSLNGEISITNKGATIERFLKDHQDAVHRFSPFRPVDPTSRTEGREEAIERFIQEHSGEKSDITPPIPMFDSPESFPFLLEEVPIEDTPFN